MKIGIIGLPQTGKSTTFDLLQEGVHSDATTDPSKARIGVIKVPDSRIDRLSGLFKPKKTTYSDIEFIDFAAITRSASNQSSIAAKMMSEIKTVDGLLHVVRLFENENVYHSEKSVDGARDYQLMMSELQLADLMLVEQRKEKVEKNLSRGIKGEEKELVLLTRLHQALEEEKPVSDMDFSGEDAALLRSYALVTAKPIVTVLNLDEDQFADPENSREKAFREAHPGARTIRLSARIESDIAELDTPEERLEFLQDLGMEEAARSRLIRTCYEMLQYISFFTVGEDEVRAWTIRVGTHAQRAAGKIHSDLEKGFIRAEVVGYGDFDRLEGSWASAKKEGVFRLEGKEYVVQDGDVMNIRFNV